jgi:hypothetical protein
VSRVALTLGDDPYPGHVIAISITGRLLSNAQDGRAMRSELW